MTENINTREIVCFQSWDDLLDVIKAKLIKHQSRIFPFKLLQRKNLLFYILSKWIEDQTRRAKTDVGDPCYRLAGSKEGDLV